LNLLGKPPFLWYNLTMEKINITGLSPEVTTYISQLETQVKTQQARIERLTEILANMQKTMYGQSSEKRKYVLGTDPN
jgi:transposase